MRRTAGTTAGTSSTTTPASHVRAAGPVTRVLAVADEWFPARGGLSSLNRYLCGALAAAGAETYCLVPGASAAERADAERSGVRLVAARRSPGTTEREALMRLPPLPSGVVPDLVIGHGRVTGQIAKALTEDHFAGAARLHLVHMDPDDIEWFKLDREDDAGVRAEERGRLELDLARDAAAVMPVGPRLPRSCARPAGRAAAAPPRPRLRRRRSGEHTAPAGRPLIMIMGRLADARAWGLELAARAIGHAWALDRAPPGSCWSAGRYGRRAPAARARPRPDRPPVRERDGARLLRGDVRDPGRPAPRQPAAHAVPGRGVRARRARGDRARDPGAGQRAQRLGELITEVAPAEAADVVVPVLHDDARDVPVWGHRITAIMTDRAWAFAKAEAARQVLARRRTWAMAAEELLGLVRAGGRSGG